MFNIRLPLLATLISILALNIIEGEIQPLWAQTSPAPEATAEVDKDEIRQKLKERLDQVVDGVQPEVLSAQPGTPSATYKWHAIFGVVSEATKNNFRVVTKLNKTYLITAGEEATLNLLQPGRSRKTVELSDIEDDWYAIAMGRFTKAEESFEAQRITFTPQPPPSLKREVILGKITEVDESTLTLTNGKTWSLTIPKNYSLKIKGTNNPDLDDVQLEDRALAVVLVEQPQPSPSPKATPKTSPKATASPVTSPATTRYTLRHLYVFPNLKSQTESPLPEEETTSATKSGDSKLNTQKQKN